MVAIKIMKRQYSYGGQKVSGYLSWLIMDYISTMCYNMMSLLSTQPKELSSHRRQERYGTSKQARQSARGWCACWAHSHMLATPASYWNAYSPPCWTTCPTLPPSRLPCASPTCVASRISCW